MRVGQASRTARHVAAYRLGFDRLATGYGDASADERLARDLVADLDFIADDRMATYLRVRTAFFDRVVTNAIERGTTQIAAIGAGYDGRSLRYAHPDVRWFELDHPATQADKRGRIERLGLDATGVTFVAADLAEVDGADVLVGSGFDPDAPSLLTCEGVVVYLDEASVAELLAGLRSLATAGTRLALSAGIPDASDDRRAALAARAAAAGEPLALGGADMGTLLDRARWRSAELSERAARAGLFVGVPEWEPGRPATRSRVGAYLEGTFQSVDIEALTHHVEQHYGIAVDRVRRLDVGVFKVESVDGPPWVARVFPSRRPLALAEADVALLRYLDARGYPAERVAAAVSEFAGRTVVVTEFVGGRKPASTTAVYRELGDLLGRLHTLPDPPPGVGGAWHHLVAEGGPRAEIDALTALVDARRHLPSGWRIGFEELRAEIARLDDLDDLPKAFSHPDFVPPNAIATPSGSLVIVDWAGAGVAARLWSFAFLVWSAGQSGPGHVRAAVAGYRQHVEFEARELDRLEAAIGARPLIFDAWAYATGRRPLLEVVAGRPAVRAKVDDIAAQVRASASR